MSFQKKGRNQIFEVLNYLSCSLRTTLTVHLRAQTRMLLKQRKLQLVKCIHWDIIEETSQMLLSLIMRPQQESEQCLMGVHSGLALITSYPFSSWSHWRIRKIFLEGRYVKNAQSLQKIIGIFKIFVRVCGGGVGDGGYAIY